jgi:hypothetical protein
MANPAQPPVSFADSLIIQLPINIPRANGQAHEVTATFAFDPSFIARPGDVNVVVAHNRRRNGVSLRQNHALAGIDPNAANVLGLPRGYLDRNGLRLSPGVGSESGSESGSEQGSSEEGSESGSEEGSEHGREQGFEVVGDDASWGVLLWPAFRFCVVVMVGVAFPWLPEAFDSCIMQIGMVFAAYMFVAFGY